MKRVLLPILLVILLSLSTVRLFAQSASNLDLMLEANQHYEDGQFREAANIYQSLVDSGFEDSVLYYNLGNAYFKQSDWGRAILNYRRAQLLTPRDSDIRDNLVLARAQTVDQIESDTVDLLSQVPRIFQRWLTLNEMAIAALTLWFLLIISIILASRIKNHNIRQGFSFLGVVSAILLVVGVISLGGRLYLERNLPEGVIVAEEVDVSSGPGSQYIVEFTLHSGTEVTVLDVRNAWTRLTLPGGQLQGWVPSDAVTAIAN